MKSSRFRSSPLPRTIGQPGELTDPPGEVSQQIAAQTANIRAQTANINKLVDVTNRAAALNQLARIAQSHDRRLENLQGSR